MHNETKQYGSHMVTTDVKQESKYKFLNVDTRFSDDFSGFDNATYNVMLPDRLTNIKSMSVTNVEILLSYFNISAAAGNNSFRITNRLTLATYTIIIPEGQYTAITLSAAISSLLPSAISFYIDSYGHSVFTVNTDESHYIEFYTDSTGSNNKYNPKFRLGWLLGFRNVSYPIYEWSSLVSESFLNLSGPRYLYLVIDEFQHGNQTSFVSILSTSLMNKQIIARITIPNIDYPYGSLLNANFGNGLLTTDTRTYNGKIDIQQLNIQLVDESGQVVDLNGDDLSFCLKLEYET